MHPKYWKSGRKPVYYAPTDGEGSGGGGALDVHAAGDALAALMGDDDAPAAADADPAADAAADDAGADQVDDGQPEQQDPEGQPDDDAITVEVDGKQVALTRAQIAEAYKTGLQQQDLTRESAQVAEQRKAAEAETQKARAERGQLAQQLQQVLAVNQYQAQQDAQWTPETIEADPVGYQLAMYAASKRAEQNQLAQAQLQAIQQQEQQEQQQAARDNQARQVEAIRKALPAWKDEAVMKKEVGEIKSWLHGQGFTDADLAGMQDHRMVLLARSAMQYDQLQKRAKETATQVAKVPPKVAAPGRQPIAPTDGRTVAMKRLSASGSVTDAASALSLLL